MKLLMRLLRMVGSSPGVAPAVPVAPGHRRPPGPLQDVPGALPDLFAGQARSWRRSSPPGPRLP